MTGLKRILQVAIVSSLVYGCAHNRVDLPETTELADVLRIEQFREKVLHRGDSGYEELLCICKRMSREIADAIDMDNRGSPIELYGPTGHCRCVAIFGNRCAIVRDNGYSCLTWIDELPMDIAVNASRFRLGLCEPDYSSDASRLLSIRDNPSGIFGIEFGKRIDSVMFDLGIYSQSSDDGRFEFYGLGRPYMYNFFKELDLKSHSPKEPRPIMMSGSSSFMGFVPAIVHADKITHEVRVVTAENLLSASTDALMAEQTKIIIKRVSRVLGEPIHNGKQGHHTWTWSFKDKNARTCAISLNAEMENRGKHWFYMLNLLVLPAVRDTVNKSTDTYNAKSLGVFNSAQNRLAIIKTGKGCGSGFIIKESGKTYLCTNEHVVRGGNPFSAMLLDGTKIETGKFQIAKNRDLARFLVSDQYSGFEVQSGVPEMDTPISVLGNSDGGQVSTEISGKIVGIGPDSIEVSAPFVRGNSGSPIVTKGGRVVGVATLVTRSRTEDWVKEGTRYDGVRRFAVRLDKIEWQDIDWDLYVGIAVRDK